MPCFATPVICSVPSLDSNVPEDYNAFRNQQSGYETVYMNKKYETASVTIADRKRESRCGRCDSSAPKAKTVQHELPDTVQPKMTLTFEDMTFNQACVNLFPNIQHVSLCIDKEKLRLLILPTEEHDKDGLHFARVKNGRNVPRRCTTRIFCQKLFTLMKWNPQTKYRIRAFYKVIGNLKVMAFNLDDARQVLS